MKRRGCSPRRPPEPPAAQHVQMNVKDRLSRVRVAVEDSPVATIGVAVLRRQCRSPANHLSNQTVVFGAEVVQRRDVPARHDEDVRGRLGVDVLDGNEPIVRIHNRARDLACDDLAEETV
jgi:NAD(P)H-dependent FMN reductase